MSFPSFAGDEGRLSLASPQVAEKTDLARIITKAKVFKLVTEGKACVGCVYEKGGQNFQEFGPVILASGSANLAVGSRSHQYHHCSL